jgi:imidazolonepropionase-like amidohydrolase
MSEVLLHDVRVVDVVAGTISAPGWLLFQQGRIARVEVGQIANAERRRLGESVRPVDGGGAFAIPGLIDAHTHVGSDEGRNNAQLKLEPDPISILRLHRNATRDLVSGVTTLRDVGAKHHIDLHYKRALEMGLVRGPRMFVSGRPIIMTGGHTHYMGRQADGPDEVRKAVREQIHAGADWIKMMATGGAGTPGMGVRAVQLREDELRAGVEVANDAGRRVAAHASGLQGAKNAVRAGVASVEHGLHLDDEVIELMLERGTFLVPTLTGYYLLATEGESWGHERSAIEKSRAVLDDHRESFVRAWRAGIPICVGTDQKHGNLAAELELLVRYGLSPLQALRAATLTNARLLGLESEIGRLAPGMRADVVLLGSDPLADIRATRDVRAVFLDGDAVPPRPI